MNYILLLLGFVLLIKGADFFVDGASAIAKKFHIPSIIIGLTIVAFGTSAPELAVSLSAALKGQNDIAVGNVLGSNLFNLLVVVGCTAIILPMNVKQNTLTKEFPFALLSAIVLPILAIDTVFQDFSINHLSKGDGLILLIVFSIFLFYLISSALSSRVSRAEDEGDKEGIKIGKSLLFTGIGLIGIVLGGKWVVDSASNIAISFGMSENLVGLTIVALGTSLPELVTSVVAAKKGENDIAIGNVIGSNMFNVFLILGLSSVISPIPINPESFFDMLVLLLVTVLVYLFAITGKRIKRWEGFVLVAIYIVYMIAIIIRN